jgi:hypothetical protein
MLLHSMLRAQLFTRVEQQQPGSTTKERGAAGVQTAAAAAVNSRFTTHQQQH